uniref:Hypothetical chloroplast protein RF1 n=1 Tax=Colemanosphaera angeleri TaxID=1454018 RepID=A0A6C0RXN4_9CHLO|nr:hypothetical chloroplast protein RF1 [Colemanosphaera angeleri]QIA47174.1 hypothetical chloroplast protein RF1 [Colemanosphaera angeleri]
MITLTLMSLATSVKDYVEITHKLIEIEPLKNYTEFGAVFTYFIFSIGDFLKNFFSFSLLKNIWSIPIIIPDIASAMISEVSVLDGYFHNAFTILETNVNTGTNPSLVIFEKFIIGLINSLFLFLPTSTSHLITLRRFVMQGLEAGYIAGLGTVAGNFLWLSSIILGLRFFVIPWLSLDIFRYLLGFILLVKYIWDSSKERRMALEDLSKWKIFLLNFLLTLTEQSCIYPFISNLSIGPDASILEGFPVETYTQFFAVHGAYLFGILLGSFSLLQFTCWFWENPAFSIYLWITTKSSLKISTSSYYKILNFTFLYATMLCAIASIPYYGLDYTITNPIGLVPQDRILDQKKSQSDPDKLITETAFLNLNPTDKNSRIRDGVHARRERWKQRLIKYQAFDASLYDQGVYDFLTIEDLNYGFDRFWLRRKMRNHQIRFRLFPGPWMRSLKKQLNNPANQTPASNKAASGPRVEFFRILFEQFYHPNFHNASHQKYLLSKEGYHNINKMELGKAISMKEIPQTTKEESNSKSIIQPIIQNEQQMVNINNNKFIGDTLSSFFLPELQSKLTVKPGLLYSQSALRKFVRNVNTRLNIKVLNNKLNNLTLKYNAQFIYSKRWKSVFSKIQPLIKTKSRKSYQLFRNVAKQLLLTPEAKSLKLKNSLEKLSTKERKLLNLRTHYLETNNSFDFVLRSLNISLQKEQAFKRKLRYYGTTPMRKLTIGNQAPYFKTLMKRGFYYYKPSLRWKKTLYVAKIIRGFRKKSRKQRILIVPDSQTIISNPNIIENKQQISVFPKTTPSFESDNRLPEKTTGDQLNLELATRDLTKPTHSYTVLGKRASRYRHQIYKDVLQHWYYTPFNRLLLKFDVDAFINRQPKSHFLSKNEERILHIRRFLLSEHYDTLRWYTYMQHYRTMKTNIGGTKSFANRTYNQQFQGTFKKIRHLFAITPKQGDFYTLKFDQPLYNDNKLSSNVYFHEELLTDNFMNKQLTSFDNSNNLLKVKEDSTKIKIDNKNNMVMSQSIDKQKLSSNPIQKLPTNLDLINQSSYLIATKQLDTPLISSSNPLILNASKEHFSFIYNELFVKLIKESKKRVHDQAFLKNYITHRIEKREQLTQEQTKEINKRLEKLKNWLNREQKIKNNFDIVNFQNKVIDRKQNNIVLTTGLQKAVNDGISLFETKNNQIKSTNNDLNNYLFSDKNNKAYSDFNLSETQPIPEQPIALEAYIQLLTIENKKQSNILSVIKTNLEKTKQLILEYSFKLITQNNKTQMLKARTDKNLQWWRKKQRVITKRKNSRKRDRFKNNLELVTNKFSELAKKVSTEKSNLYKTLYGTYDISDYLLTNPQTSINITNSNLLRKKQDNMFKLQRISQNNTSKTKSNLLYYLSKSQKEINQELWQGADGMRKKISSKGRRYRPLSLARYLTATRKPRLAGLEGLIKLDNISSLKGSFLTKEEKQELINLISKNKVNVTNSLKKSQIKKRSRHAWKKRSRHQFSLNHYKYRKRHIHGNGKLRVINKKLKKFKATNELRQWWWASFLPRYLNNLQTLSINNNKQKRLSSVNNDFSLQQKPFGEANMPFKPLSNSTGITKNTLVGPDSVNSSQLLNQTKKGMKSNDSNILLDNLNSSLNNGSSLPMASVNLTTTSIPFYAGWDDSLRKFVVTNRLLSRRDAGLVSKNITKQNYQETMFTNAPLQGLNEGSFLYWQTSMPFNSYNIDQFITTNQSFYAPLGWRHFEFRHSILKTWAFLLKEQVAKNNLSSQVLDTKNKTLIVSMKNLRPLSIDKTKQGTINLKKGVARRIKKRYKLLKQTPNILIYSPTGPLNLNFLPSHYISVFDQQYRFPRNRYLKRTTLKTMKKTTLLSMIDAANSPWGASNKEFTLRKRVKPRRKYHRKRFIKKDGLIFPRRTKFSTLVETENLNANEENLRWRPSSKSKQKRKETLRIKTKSNKRVKTNPLRLRQLRRREFQQILKPIQRYIPQNGGFAWPGDYLRLEVVEMPKLKSTNLKKMNQRRKINVQPVGIMPRKYLIEKHNIKVLKKKLEKAYSSHQLSKVVQEYKILIQNQQ